jgi:hypothetical protein
VAVARWLYFEATNPLNLQEPVVLAFVPVRGIMRLLDAFDARVVQGMLAGTGAGLLMSAWLLRGGRGSTRRERMLVGAVSGALAACLMVLVIVGGLEGGRLGSLAGAIAFEIGLGTVCGMVAATRAVGFFR